MSDIIIVSACLAGINCRYNGTNGKVDKIEQMVLSGKAIPICPEVLGGLSIPRPSCEIKYVNSDRLVISKEDEDVTGHFRKGAEKTLSIAFTIGVKTAILKSRSPSGGFGEIYDGNFSGTLIAGNGLTAELLADNNIRVLNEENFETALKFKKNEVQRHLQLTELLPEL